MQISQVYIRTNLEKTHRNRQFKGETQVFQKCSSSPLTLLVTLEMHTLNLVWKMPLIPTYHIMAEVRKILQKQIISSIGETVNLGTLTALESILCKNSESKLAIVTEMNNADRLTCRFSYLGQSGLFAEVTVIK